MPETNGNVKQNGEKVLSVEEKSDRIKQLRNLLKGMVQAEIIIIFSQSCNKELLAGFFMNIK